MDKRKVVYVCDVNNTTEFMTSRPVRALLDPLWEKYNVDFVTVQDQENLGMSFTQFAEKFEKTGPEWYTPPQKVLDAISDAEVILMNYVLAPKMFLDAAKQCISAENTGVPINLPVLFHRLPFCLLHGGCFYKCCSIVQSS